MAIGDMVVPFTLDNLDDYTVDISPDTRVINVPEDFILGVESDEKAQRVFFTCPKIVGYDFDMSKASVYINFENANGEKDAYRVEDLNVNEELEEVTFSWLLSRKVTAYKGQVSFIVCAKISNENGIIQKEWNTTVATAISLVGLEAIAKIEQENYDILEEILRKVKNIEENGVDVDLSVYQNKTDNELKTKNKTIVGAINEIKDNQKDLPIASSTQLGGVKPVAKTDDMTQEELEKAQVEQRKYEVYGKHRPLTPDEVNQMLIKAQINSVEIDDKTSLRMLDYYPTWQELIGQTVSQGFKFTYNGNLYKVIQSHTLSESWVPDNGTESLYTRIDEEHDGDLYDPVPYEGNMALVNGKYYTQYGVVYLCNRDTGVAVYHPLKDLVDIYVAVVNTENI